MAHRSAITEVIIEKSKKPEKKLQAVIDGKKTVPFGQAGASNYTLHKNPARKKLYIQRHSGMHEDWNKSGIKTAGFYSRWVLWNKPTLKASVDDLNKKYKDVHFKLKV